MVKTSIRYLVLVTGFSGSGRSSTLKYLEDLGFFWIDNLPLQLVPAFMDYLVEEEVQRYHRGAIGIHMRGPGCQTLLDNCRQQLLTQVEQVDILFLEANFEQLVRRYRETRRRHPLAIDRTVREAIELEATYLEPLRAMADLIIDTSATTVPALKDRLDMLFHTELGQSPDLMIFLRSFGFKYGTNSDADMVLDGRFLANPYYDPSLRHLTGLDEPVQRFLEQSHEAEEFLDRLQALFDYLVPRYRQEKKRYLTVDIGCTGGQHRSVYLVTRLAQRLTHKGFQVLSRHRDLNLGHTQEFCL
ncbi:MAG: RNase adapter RapZ [Magnetococcales bacterium]|nr:RNase adapter RapZ [Magnetococcales bacterium]